MFMQDFGTTGLVATPSYILHLTEVMKEQGISPNDLKLRVGLFGGEGHTLKCVS
jgi:phenylacetate-CoA ligase